MTFAGGMWDRRFAEQPWPSEPDPLLAELAGALPAGRGLGLRGGPGRNTPWLAVNGWDMVLLDASSSTLSPAQARAEQADARIEPVRCDVLEWRPQGPSCDLATVANLHPAPGSPAQMLATAADVLGAGTPDIDVFAWATGRAP